MALWHCSHCGTAQPETGRCWVCHRSSTTCGTCRHFARGIAGGLGVCGLERVRRPRRADEVHGCWEAQPATLEAASGAGAGATGSVATRPEASGPRWTEVVPPAGRAGNSPRPGAAATGGETERPAPLIDPPPAGLWSELDG
jgi:hypothetical protein